MAISGARTGRSYGSSFGQWCQRATRTPIDTPVEILHMRRQRTPTPHFLHFWASQCVFALYLIDRQIPRLSLCSFIPRCTQVPRAAQHFRHVDFVIPCVEVVLHSDRDVCANDVDQLAAHFGAPAFVGGICHVQMIASEVVSFKPPAGLGL